MTKAMRMKKAEWIFFTLSISNILLESVIGVGYLSYVLFGVLVVSRLMKRLDNQEYLIYSLFVPNKYIQMLSVFFFLIFANKIIPRKYEKKQALFFLFILFSGIINCVFYGGAKFAVIFQFAVYYCIFMFISSLRTELHKKALLALFDKMFLLQVITVAIELVITKSLGDSLTGTLISAHYLGCFLMIYAYFLIESKCYQNVFLWVRIVFLAACLSLIDAKHVVAIFIVSFILARILRTLGLKKPITFTFFSMTICLFIFICLLKNDNVRSAIANVRLLSVYILDANYNKKITYYARAFSELQSINGLFGFGVGQFGSQICITLAKGIIYEWNKALSNYSYAIVPFVNSIKGLMSEWYTLYGIPISSMVLGYPLVSYIAIFAELGIWGSFLFCDYLDAEYERKNPIFVIAFFMLSNFDTYFEIPCVFIMILIATYLLPYPRKIKCRYCRNIFC